MSVLKSLDSDLLEFIVEQQREAGEQLPSLNALSELLQINVGKLREQLEVARTLGLVEVRPRTGIRVRPYEFLPAVRLSLLFAIALDKSRYFEMFSELRNHVEAAFLAEAAACLTPDDRAALRALIEQARTKLNGTPVIQIPHAEHRRFHMGMYIRLDNPFVIGILDAYWDAYEAVELNTYAEINYWQEAWDYHAKILDNIESQDYDAAKAAFIEHTQLVRHRITDKDAQTMVSTTASTPNPA